MAKTTSPFKLFLKNKKNRILLAVAALSVIAAGVVTLLPKREFEKIPERIPEIFPVTGAYQGYFELKTSAGTTAVPQGTEVVVDVYLVTSGEPFDAAVAMAEWDGTEFSYKTDSSIGHLLKSTGALYSFAATQPEGATNKLIMAHYTTGAETPMTTTYGQLKKFASFTLVAQVDRPSSTVSLSTALDAEGNHKDLLVHFVDSTESNSADQTLTSADKEKVEFYLCSSGEAWCDGSIPKTCSADRKTWVSQPDCSLSDQYCSNGSCLSYTCDIGDKRCYNDKVEVCSADRKGWDLQNDCAASDQYCDPATLTCLAYACEAGETRCNGSNPEECTADRLGWQPSTNEVVCGAAGYCSNGKCVSSVCQYDFDGNGEVGFGDLLYILAHWAEGSIEIFLQVLWGYGTVCN